MRLNPNYKQIAIAICSLLILSKSNSLNAQALNLNTDLNSIGALNKNAYGFTTSFMYNLAAEEVNNKIQLKEEIKPMLEEIGPNLLRFPSGTISNFYHFNGAGYGIKRDELPPGVIYQQIESDEKFTQNFIIPFAETAKRTNSEVLYVVNLRSHFLPIDFLGYKLKPHLALFKYFFKENMDAIRYLMDNDVDVVGIELGNENYFDGIMTHNYRGDSLRGFMQLNQMYADSIRHYWPELKIGVTVPEAANSNLQKVFVESFLKYDFYDAFIVHAYLQNINGDCPLEMEQGPFYECAAMQVEDFFNNKLAYYENDYFPLLSANDKKIWITEWNLNSPERLANNYFHASFLFRLFHKLLDIDNKLGNPIEYMTFHSLIGSKPNYPVIAPINKYKESDTIAVYGGDYTYKAAHYSMRLFKDLFEHNFHKINHTLVNEEDTTTSSQFLNWTYYDDQTGHLKFYFLNNSAEDVSIDLSSSVIGSINQPMQIQNAQMSYVQADALHSFAGINYTSREIDDKIGNQLRHKDNIILNPFQKLDIPNFTLGVIDIMLDDFQPRTSGIDTFYVTEQDCKHYLNFRPSFESGNLKYSLSRLDNTSGFYENIQEIHVSAVNETPDPYQVEVKDPSQDLNEYRLIMYQDDELIREFNAAKDLSCIVDDNLQFDLQVSPTITTDGVKARIKSSGMSFGQLIISELTSGPILEQNILLTPGINKFDFSLQNMGHASAGYYTMSIIVGDQTLSEIFLYFP